MDDQRPPPLPDSEMQQNPEKAAQQFTVDMYIGAGWFFRAGNADGLRAFGLHLPKTDAAHAEDIAAGHILAPPQRPVVPAASASEGNRLIYKEAKMEYDLFIVASQAYLAWVIKRAGSTIAKALAQPNGYPCMCTRQIARYVNERWGGRSDRTMELAERFLQDANFTNPDTYDADVVNLTQEFHRLEHVGQPKSEYDKVRTLERAVRHLPAAQAGVAAFHRAVPARAEQRYQDLVAFIHRYFNQVSTMGAAFGGHAQGKHYTQADLDAAVAKAQSATATTRTYTHAEFTAAVAAAGTAGAPLKRQTLHEYKWCCEHGWCGHSTADCRVVKAARPSKYTAAQRAATQDPEGTQPPGKRK